MLGAAGANCALGALQSSEHIFTGFYTKAQDPSAKKGQGQAMLWDLPDSRPSAFSPSR